MSITFVVQRVYGMHKWNELWFTAVAGPGNPMRWTLPACCARAASGHVQPFAAIVRHYRRLILDSRTPAPPSNEVEFVNEYDACSFVSAAHLVDGRRLAIPYAQLKSRNRHVMKARLLGQPSFIQPAPAPAARPA
jgi:hypothetical protein